MRALAPIIEQLAHEGVDRFRWWNDEAWRQLIRGPAQALVSGSRAAGQDEAYVRTLARSYLTMARDAVGLGHLQPEGMGAMGFFHRAWTDLIPRLLPRAPAELHGELLSTLWTLGENLNMAPPWLNALLACAARQLDTLDGLEAWVADLTLEALDPTEPLLDERHCSARWIDLAAHEPAFVPGEVRFVSPTVVWVADRRRRDAYGRPIGLGVWLSKDGPRILNPLPPPEGEEPVELIEDAAEVFAVALAAEPRLTEICDAQASLWRGAAILGEPRALVALMP